MRRKKAADASFKLEDMTTHEVSLVDLAANLRSFITLKSTNMAKKPKTDAKPDMTSKVMALPSEARTAISEGLQDALEKLAAITQSMKEATVDDAADVPEELPRMIKEAADVLGKVAGQYLGEGGEIAETETDDETEKAGRLTPSRIATITTARDAAAEQVASLTALLEGAPASAPATSDAPTTDQDGTAKVFSQLVETMSLLGKQIDNLTKAHTSQVAKSDAALADIAKMRAQIQSPGESRSEPTEGAPVTKSKEPFAWPEDLADHYGA
jgi:hypothetical protein